MKRLMSFLLSFVMVCSLVPAPALAEAVDELEAIGAEQEVALDEESEEPAPSEDQMPADEEPLPVDETQSEDSAETPEGGDEDPLEHEVEALAGETDLRGWFVDEESGAKWWVEWLDDGGGLAITAVELAEGEGDLDIVVPAGPVTYTTDGGYEATGTITAVSGAFYHWGGTNEARARVRSVTIPNTITRIDAKMFQGTALRGGWTLDPTGVFEVYFEPAGDDAEHAGVTTLPDDFFSLSFVSRVTLPTNLTAVSDNMFNWCDGITSVELPPRVEEIGYRGFANCAALESVSFNEGLKHIGEQAFYHWDRAEHPILTTAELPNSLESIGNKAFADVNTLASVSFGTSLTNSHLKSIGDWAFENAALSEVLIPDSVESIGAWAFSSCRDKDINDGGHYTIQTIELGSSQEASQLQTIGSGAFFRSQITEIVLPNKLTNLGYDLDGDLPWTYEHGDCSKSAFYASTELTNIVWPTQPPANGLGLTHIGGFDNCRKLSPSVVERLPWWITTIDRAAFEQSFTKSGETSLTIPSTVTNIGEKAFSGTCDTWESIPQIDAIIFEDGREPLSIEYRAISGSSMPGSTIVLPSRLSSLGPEALCQKGTYYVYNENLQIEDGAYPWTGDSTVYYPSTAAEDSGIIMHKNACAQNDRGTTFLPFDVNPTYDITGTVPEGSAVKLLVNGAQGDVELTDNSFTATQAANSAVAVIVSLEGYSDYEVRPSDDGTLTGDWSFEVTVDDMTPLATTGNLSIVVTKDRPTFAEQVAATVGCNVLVFDSSGKLVYRSAAPTSGTVVTPSLPKGIYTVVAFDKNEHFSSVAGVDDFARMGVVEGSWATSEAEIVAGKVTNLELPVPDLQLLGANEILQSGELAVTEARFVPGYTFFARVSYQMKEGKQADKVQLSIPQGMVPVSAATLDNVYGTAGYDAASHVLTLDVRGLDARSATVFVGLRVDVAGSYGIGASVVSGAVVAPVGSATVNAPALTLEVPHDELPSETFDVDVYAAPNSTVYFSINDTEIMDPQTTGQEGSIERPLCVTTNKLGHATATLTIPEEVLGDLVLYNVKAQVRGTDDAVVAEANDMVTYRAVKVGSSTLREWELSFVHGGKQIYLVRDGKEIHNPYYTVYAYAGHAPQLYSPTWPFTSIFDSERELGDTAILMLEMMDGSRRDVEMSLVGTPTQNDDGTKRYTYMVSVPIGDGDPNHDLLAKDIPIAFEVATDFADAEGSVGQTDLSEQEMETLSLLALQRHSTLEAQQVSAASTLTPDANPTTGVYRYAPNAYAYLRNAGYTEDELGDFDFGQVIFGKKYTHEVWDPDHTAWNSLSESQQTEITKYEDSLTTYFDCLQEMNGDKKPLYEYGSWNEWLEGEMGYEELSSSTDPQSLKAQGYTVVYNRGAGEDEFEWCAFRLMHEGEVSALAPKPEEFSYPEFDPVKDVEAIYKFQRGVHKLAFDAQKFGQKMFSRPYDNPRMSLALTGLGEMGMDGLISTVTRTGSKGAAFASILGSTVLSITGLPFTYGIIKDDLMNMALHDERADQAASQYLDSQKNLKTLEESGGGNTPCAKALRAELDAIVKFMDANEDCRTLLFLDVLLTAEFQGVSLFFAIKQAISGTLSQFMQKYGTKIAIANAGWTLTSIIGYEQLANWSFKLKQDYEEARRTREQRCTKEAKLKYRIKTGIDPSGYAYEAVDGNRVEGATATVQYSADGGESWAAWDEAPDYEQTATLTTDAAGIFAWDVPQGLWRVLLQKVGFEDTYSVAMEVPPARTGIALPMVTLNAPSIASLTVDKQYIEVEFAQYMKTEDEKLPTVSIAGLNLDGAEWVDPTPSSSADDAPVYAKVLRVPMYAGATVGNTVEVTVANAENYAGLRLYPEVTQNVKIAARPAQIVLDYGETVSQQVGTNKELAVRVLDADGNPVEDVQVKVSANNEHLAVATGAQDKTDALGATTVDVEALLPGTSKLTFSVMGTSLKRTVGLVTTLDENRSGKPTAQFAGTTTGGEDAPEQEYVVSANTKVELASSTQDALVYYTLDGSDPATSATRMVYKEPLTISSDVTLRTVSYKDGMDYSEEMAISLRVRRSLAQAQVGAIADKTYTGKAIKPRPTVKLDGVTLVLGRDYTLSYVRNTNAGTATVKVTGRGDYEGTITQTFKIKRASIAKASVSTIANQAYTANKVTPKPTIKVGETTLKLGTDYKLAYKNNVKAGTATITITGMGNYAGTKTVTFKIVAPSVQYYVHRQTYGDEEPFSKKDGDQSGTTGQGKRLEAIRIRLASKPVTGGITYRTHVQKIGWQDWRKDGNMSGTSGEALRLEAIQIKLTGQMAQKYDVYYRVHAQHYGWMGWAKNGVQSGTAGYAYRLEAIQIVLVPKGGKAPATTFQGASQQYAKPFAQK